MMKSIRSFTLPLFALCASGTAAHAQADSAETQFKMRCGACLTVAPGGASGPIAPNLRGVVGRKAAASAFKAYSPALKASKLTWTPASLDKYLAAPAVLVPGTRMMTAVSNPAQRAALIAWLGKQR